MSLARSAWALHQGVPMTCGASWNGNFYFGTAGGKVCVNQGSTDNVGIDTSENAIAIDAKLLTGSADLGSARRKRINMIRPLFVTDGTPPSYAVEARYDFDQSEISTTLTAESVDGFVYGTSSYDVGVWGTGVGTAGRFVGSYGFGSRVGIALSLSTTSRATLTGFDVLYTEGGAL